MRIKVQNKSENSKQSSDESVRFIYLFFYIFIASGNMSDFSLVTYAWHLQSFN